MLKQKGYQNNYYENKYAILIDPVIGSIEATSYAVAALKNSKLLYTIRRREKTDKMLLLIYTDIYYRNED